MSARSLYINIFLTSLALIGMADLSHAAPDTGSVQNLPGSLTNDLADTNM